MNVKIQEPYRFKLLLKMKETLKEAHTLPYLCENCKCNTEKHLEGINRQIDELT